MRTSIILTALMLGSPALAQEGTAPDWADKNGAVGIGANTTVGGTNGLTFRTYVSPLFGIEAVLGFRLFSATTDPTAVEGDEITQSSLLFATGLYGTYKLAYWQRGSLALLFGGDVQTVSSSIDVFGTDFDTETSTTNVLLGLGLQAEWFPTQYLSIYAQGGLRLDLLDDDDFVGIGKGGADTNPEVSGIDIGLGSDLLGAAGVTVWFK